MLQGRRSCTVARSGAYELGVAQTSKSILRFLQLCVEAMCFTFVSTTNQCIISTSSHQKYSKNRISISSSHVIPKSSNAPARTNGFHRLNQLFCTVELQAWVIFGRSSSCSLVENGTTQLFLLIFCLERTASGLYGQRGSASASHGANTGRSSMGPATLYIFRPPLTSLQLRQ